MSDDFKKLEKKWRKFWRENNSYKTILDHSKPKYYILDMFPYPSGAGLHVGHPRGYIASDIIARYKRNKGFNVLHPMGYDAFGLPAEQYAIQTGQHPETTTDKNISRYREQLDLLGFSFDWDRSFRTCDEDYYKWTQWAFLKMFNSYYDEVEEKAKPIEGLIKIFSNEGSVDFSKEEWSKFSEKEKNDILDKYRLAYLSDIAVNWCPALGTVLANDEIKNGYSVRGGHPVEQKVMKQWALRISSYAPRLLEGLDSLDWSDSIKEIQRNWIGKTVGTVISLTSDKGYSYEVFTDHPESIFGMSFVVISSDKDSLYNNEKVFSYIEKVKNNTLRDRQIAKEITGVFTGDFVKHPFTGKNIPIYVSDYVFGDDATGVFMGTPEIKDKDKKFAELFNLNMNITLDDDKNLINSDFLNGLNIDKARAVVLEKITTLEIGCEKIFYKLKDATFSRQRYWGEPIPVYFVDGIPHPVDEKDLPIKLPSVDSYLPTENGEPPLARAKDWTYRGFPLESSTMPGFAGSSAYFFRYMDSDNDESLVDKDIQSYWENVDLYVGGSEHATGHLIYSRFWTKVLYDLGFVSVDEPFKKLLNQGMIQGRSSFVYRVLDQENTFVSYGLKDQYETQAIHVNINFVKNDILDIDSFLSWREEFKNAKFILENNQYICGSAVEKMSKSMFNVVNPDDIVKKYGADTLRVYEMFLGPVTDAKSWSTDSISGSYNFLKKFKDRVLNYSNEDTSKQDKIVLNKAVKKITEDIENFSFNTAIAEFMTVNKKIKIFSREIAEKLTIMLSPFAPHLCQELWVNLGFDGQIFNASWVEYDDRYLKENTFDCPVMINNKKKALISTDKDFNSKELESFILNHDEVKKLLSGKDVVKVVAVQGKICNIIIK